LMTPLGLGRCISLEYIEVTFGLAGVNVSGLEGRMSKRECWMMDPKRPRDSISKGSMIMFWSRMLPMTVLPLVVIPVVR